MLRTKENPDRKICIGWLFAIVVVSILATLALLNILKKNAYGLEPLRVRWVGRLLTEDMLSNKVVVDKNVEIGLRDDGVVVWRRR